MAFAMSLSVVFGGCFDNASGSTNGGDDSISDNGVNDIDGSDEVDGSDKLDDADEVDENVSIDNADILALSYDRLENADLSFNFDMDLSANKTVKSARISLSDAAGSAIASASELTQDDAENVYSVDKDSYQYKLDTDYDFFESVSGTVKELGNGARDIADYMVDNITVVNKRVKLTYNDYEVNYMLNYDSQTDELTAINYEVFDNGYTFRTVKIYYDDLGKEIVEMWSSSYHDISALNFVYHIVYSAGQYYSYECNQWEYGSDGKRYSTYQINTVYKQDGLWRGVQFHFNKDNAYLTKEGTYDLANGVIYITYLFETEDAIYSLSDSMVAYRDGKRLGTTDALSTDEMEMLFSRFFYINGIYWSCDYRQALSFSLEALTGWESLTLIPGDELLNVSADGYCQGVSSWKEYNLTLSNGVSIPNYSVWTEEYGWLAPGSDNSGYFTLDGEAVSYEDIDTDCAVLIYYIFSLNLKTHETYNVAVYFNDFTNGDDGYSDEACKKFLRKMDACLKSNGIGFVDGVNADALADMAELVDDKYNYSTLLYEELYGVKYTVDNVVQVELNIAKVLDDYEDSVSSYFDGVEMIAFDEMPKKPANLGLVKLSSSVSGKVSASESGIDYSGVSVEIKKSVILSEDSSYNVFVAFANADGSVYSEAFSAATYAQTAMTFVGNVAELPQAQEGEYTLKAYFGKVVDNSAIRLSEIISLPSDEFADVTYSVEAEGGYYSYKVYYDGEIKLSVKFVDTLAPNIIVDGGVNTTIDDEEFVLVEVPSGTKVSDLILLLTAEDKRDGSIEITLKNLSIADGELASDDELIDEQVITVNASDEAGNESTVKIMVNVLASDEESEADQADAD
jgi:hypothetical protein